MMLDFQQKRKARSFMYNKVTLGLLFVVVVLLAHSTWGVWNKKSESERLKNISMARVLELRDRESDLKSKIQRLETDQGLEEEIRAKFSVAKENESMVLVVLEESTTTATTTPKAGFWGSIKRFFSQD